MTCSDAPAPDFYQGHPVHRYRLSRSDRDIAMLSRQFAAVLGQIEALQPTGVSR